MLLVRKGGFAVARLAGDRFVESKVGQRHVQGRTKAGGQSQQRFARRRDNQARQAYEAAAEHAARILATDAAGSRSSWWPVATTPRSTRCSRTTGSGTSRSSGPCSTYRTRSAAVLEQAVADACSARVEVVNA